MKKNSIRSTILLVVLVSFSLLVSACAKKDMPYYDMNIGDYSKGSSDSGEMDVAEAEAADDGSLVSNSASLHRNQEPDLLAMEKIIHKVDLDVETLEFDDLISNIEEEIEKLGGYVETSNIRGRKSNSVNGNRWGEIVARIPKDNLGGFVDLVYENSNVVSRTKTSENVTLDYVDTESRKKALEIEQERLFDLLDKAKELEEIITLESRLSNVRYELQNYETKIRTIDNQVDYSTVTINITEVERIVPKVEEKATVYSRIKTGFSETIYDISENLKDFFVWFVINLPYLIIWAVAIIIVVLVLKKSAFKKNRKEKDLVPKKEVDKDEKASMTPDSTEADRNDKE